MGLVYVVSLVASAAVILLVVPLLAWKGRPKGFSRLNWVGVALGAGVFAIMLVYAGSGIEHQLAEEQAGVLPVVTFFVAGLFGATAVGALLAVFFHRTAS